MSAVTTHVLDTALGRPAAGVPVQLRRGSAVLAEARTDSDGRVGELGPVRLDPGVYELDFDVASYAEPAGQPCFFPNVTLRFVVADDAHHHVPLLLSPFAYSTYRGS